MISREATESFRGLLSPVMEIRNSFHCSQTKQNKSEVWVKYGGMRLLVGIVGSCLTPGSE